MPAYNQPTANAFALLLAGIQSTARGGVLQTTTYVVDPSTITATSPGVCEFIVGNVAFDHAGNSTGLTGWGAASHSTGSWVKL